MPDNRCADCGCELHEFTGRTIKAESTQYGVYYEGDPICSDCKNDRYENFIAKNESEENQ